MKRLILLVTTFLYGCVNHLHTEIKSDVCIKPLKAYTYLTCLDIEFSVDSEKFIIPKGFETNLASIPKIAWPILAPAHSSLIRPAIIHDWFYRKTCVFTRKQVDLIFFHMMLNDGISVLRANIMYYAVRLFGWGFYSEAYCD